MANTKQYKGQTGKNQWNTRHASKNSINNKHQRSTGIGDKTQQWNKSSKNKDRNKQTETEKYTPGNG